MEPEKTIKSTLKVGSVATPLIAGALFLSLGTYFLHSSIIAESVDLSIQLLAASFTVIGLVAITSILKVDRLEVTGKKIVISSVLGYRKGEIKRSDIMSYFEIERANKSGNIRVLTLRTNSSNYSISSSTIANYEELRNELTKGLSADPEAAHNMQFIWNRTLMIFLLVTSAGLLAIALIQYKSNLQEITSSQVKTIEGVITSGPRSVGQEQLSYIDIQLEQYPDITFSLIGSHYEAANVNAILNNLQVGSKVELSIELDEYEKKISKTMELEFFDRLENLGTVNICELKDASNYYMNLHDLNLQRRADAYTSPITLVAGGLSLLLLAAGIYLFFTNKRFSEVSKIIK